MRKQSSIQWVGVLWRPCDVTIITMLQNAISQIANPRANFGNLFIYKKIIPYIQTSSWELMTSLLAICQWKPFDTGGLHSLGKIDAGALIFEQLFARTNCGTNIRVGSGLRRYRSHFHYWNFDRLSFKLERWFIYSLPRRSFTPTMVHTCTVSVCRRTDRRTDKV